MEISHKLFRPLIFLVFSLSLQLLAEAQRTPPQNIESWADRLVSVYYKSSDKHGARLGNRQDCVEAARDWREALTGKTAEEVKLSELAQFIFMYDPIWKGDRYQKSESIMRIARIKLLSGADIKKWQIGLKATLGVGVSELQISKLLTSELWTIGFMVDIERLFNKGSFNITESALLLRRLEMVPKNVVEALENTAQLLMVEAIVLIIQNDSFFGNSGFQQRSFDEGMTAIKAKIAALKNQELLNAAGKGDTAAVIALIAKGADVNAKAPKGGLTGLTALMLAANGGHTSTVEALLAKGADINAMSTDSRGATALIIAADAGHNDVVKALLAKGANVNTKNKFGGTALTFAAVRNHIAVLETLLAKGADINAKDENGQTALFQAANFDRAEAVQALLAKGADVNAGAENGQTALIAAATRGHLATLQILLAKGVNINVNAGPSNGLTALMVAAAEGHTAIVEALLSKGADANLKSIGGITTLMAAVMQGHFPIVRVLLAKGVDVNAKNSDNETALMIAKAKGHSAIVQLLKEAGARE